MLQVKTFVLPDQEKEANEFLLTHMPTGQGVNFNRDMMFVFYDNGEQTTAYRESIVRGLIDDAEAAKFQQEIALATMKDERDNSGAVETNRYKQLTHGINELEEGIKKQNAKIAFLNTRLAEYAQTVE